jgi:hypothetical protein
MYADQPSGLGAEMVLFDGKNYGEGYEGYPITDYEEDKWMWHLEKWERDGRPGGKPPGVGNAGPPVASSGDVKLDYTLWTSSYLLRPEVCISIHGFRPVVLIRPDIGIHVCDVSHNQRCQMAGSWMADLGGYRVQDTHL